MSISIKVNAKQNSILGIFDNKLKIALNAKPIQGRANKALIKYLANVLNITQHTIEIVRGETSHIKLIRLPLVVKQRVDLLIEKGVL